jgi:hypothetical protein
MTIATGNTPVVIPLSQFVLADGNLLLVPSATAPQTSSAAQNSNAGDSTVTKTAGAANPTGIFGGSQTSSAATSTASSGHSTQGGAQNSAQSNVAGGQTAQQSQSGAVQAAAIAAKPIDTGAAPMQTVPAHAPSHNLVDSQGNAAGAVEVTHAQSQLAHAEAADTPSPTGIDTARVIQKMSETEMHVGINSAEFGGISIRTTVSQQQMMTQISVDHGELGKAISAQIPAVQQKLGDELGLRATVEVSQNGMSYSAERDQSSPKQQRTTAAIKQIDSTVSTDATYTGTTAVVAAGHAYRLDIRA